MKVDIEKLNDTELKSLIREAQSRLDGGYTLKSGTATLDRSIEKVWRVGIKPKLNGKTKRSKLISLVRGSNPEDLLPQTEEIIADLQGLADQMRRKFNEPV